MVPSPHKRTEADGEEAEETGGKEEKGNADGDDAKASDEPADNKATSAAH